MKRSKSGFSMTELLTVVAILAVLIAVAVPAVIAASKTLKMRELDDTAREIFLAAQNTLTARKADGTLSAPEGDQVEGQEGWYWLFDGDTDFLLPDGAVEPAVAENHIAIWYNAGSAMVVEVYYGEKNGSFASPGCDEWDVGDIQNGAYSNSRSRSGSAGEARAEKRIGYYDGTDLPRGAVEQLLPPVLEIVNSDELKVIVTVPKQHKKNDLAAPLIPSELTVLVEGTGEGGQKVLLSFGQTGCTDISSGDSRKYELVLDSLTEESLQFKKVCPTISPGANIRVTAKLSAPPAADGTKYLSASAWKETNSLFEARTGDTVSVACARHLQNLEDGFSGFTSDSAVKAEQVENIDWAKTGLAYRSISNARITSYNGNGLEIRGLNGGLFDSTSNGMTLDGIRIVNPKINGTGTVGALANTASGANIDDCRVYAVALNAGGTSNYTALKSDYTVISADGTAGGLIGRAEDCTIQNSFAALSKVSGSTAGGLIGSASGCTITNCYATAENLSGSTSAMFIGSMTGGNVTGCYATGNITSGGTVSGFANGSGEFSNSYCAVSYNNEDGTPTGTKPQYGFAGGTINTCAYLYVNAPVNENSAAHKNYEELKAWVNDWQTLSAAQTHPYRAELDGEAYPFPGLDIMPHYGSWPVQTVDGIKLFDGNAAGSRELKYILVPKGGSATFWVEAQSDDKAAMVEPEVGDVNGTVLFKISAGSYDPATGRKSVTVKGSLFTGTTYVDLTAEGFTLRAVVVVYDASLTLSGQAASGSPVKNSAASDAPQSVQRLLSLEADNYAVFHADLQIEPTVDTVNNDLNSIRAGLSGTGGSIELSVPDGYQIQDTMWRGFQVVRGGTAQKTGGPGVAVNPAVDAENRIYILADKAGTNAQYPYASGTPVMGADGKSVTSAWLEVIGQSAGTAQIAVSWAMDDSLTVVCPVNVSGAQVAIKTASAQEDGGRDLGRSKKNYPYLLHIKPAPKKSFTLKFESQLFGNPPAGAKEISYAWTVSKSSGTVIGTGTGANTSITITDQEAQADYRVKLVYSYKTAGKLYATSDFMHVTVTRVTEKSVGGGNDIVVTLPDGAANIVLEQIDWGEEVEAPASWPAGKKLTEATVYGQVDGSADTQLEWLLKADTYNADDKRITGQEGSVEVKGPEDKVIAVLNWTPEEVVGKSRGGQVRVTALDSSYYEREMTFTLIARAKDNSLTPDEKEIVVTIMPKLRITPQSEVKMVYIFQGLLGSTEAEFQSNRTDSLWEENWNVPDGLDPSVSADKKILKVSTSNYQTKKYVLGLQYGPYQAEAVFMTKQSLNSGITTAINEDGTYTDSGTEIAYVLLEKGETKNLVFSWYYSGSTEIRKIPTPSAELMEFKGSASNSSGSSPGSRSHQYEMTGKKFSDSEIRLSWDIYRKPWIGSGTVETHGNYAVFIVGADFSEKSISVGKGNDASATLTLSSYFPSAVEADGGTVTLRSSAEDIISVSGEGVTASTDVDGQVVYSYTAKDRVDKGLTITGERYGSVVLTASYAVNGKTYTDSCVVRVEPEAGTLSVRLETCDKDDLSSIKELFGLESLPAYAATYADYDGSREPTLLTDTVFGHDTLYLKAYVVDGEGSVVSADPNVFASAFASGNSYVASCESQIGRMTDGAGNKAYCYLLEIKGKNGMKDGEVVEITASFGTLKQTKAIHVYSQPSVVFEPEVMTNDHTVIRGSEFATGQKKNFKAHLEPLLLDEDGKTLDSLKWYLEYPEAENDAGFLVLSQTEDGGSAEVEMLANPWLKVAVTAQSRTAYEAALTETDADQKWKLESTSVAAHALVFLPDEGTGSGSMTRRKRYNVLGA